MTDAELVPYVAIALTLDVTVDVAWRIVREVAADGMSPEELTRAVYDATAAHLYPVVPAFPPTPKF